MSTPYVGEIRLFAFPRIPEGWFACDGSLKSIAEYQILYTLLGTTYGGDGATTFAVPDLRGRVPLHMGTGLGLSARVLGEASGSEAVTLLSASMPQHSHGFMATSGNANAATPSSAVQMGALAGDNMYASDLSGAQSFLLNPVSIGLSGGNGPHENVMPTLTASFCIAWAGVFPSQG